ncbi:MAG: hypothetical protein FRX49_08040 [Trebouxia sp. A1-2]|nr:MAG: hypothetical protein FRX49_08040 [Trebouxia sp. A1-2]
MVRLNAQRLLVLTGQDSRKRLMTGTARCTNSRLRAGLSGPALIRQSSERLPLVMDEKAKLATLNIQCTVPGAACKPPGVTQGAAALAVTAAPATAAAGHAPLMLLSQANSDSHAQLTNENKQHGSQPHLQLA